MKDLIFFFLIHFYYSGCEVHNMHHNLLVTLVDIYLETRIMGIFIIIIIIIIIIIKEKMFSPWKEYS